MITETFILEPENYRPKDIVKYRHLSPSGNRALENYSVKSWLKLLKILVLLGLNTVYFFVRVLLQGFAKKNRL